MLLRTAQTVLAAALLPLAGHAQDAVPAPGPLLTQLGAERGELQELTFRRAGTTTLAEVRLAGHTEQLVLRPHSVRAADYRLLVQDATGELQPHEPSPIRTVRGTVAGYPESLVAGSLVDGAFVGLVRLDPEADLWTIHSAADVDPSYAPAQHVVFNSSDEEVLEGFCGVLPEPFAQIEPDEGGSTPQGGGALVLELACDTDVQFFNDNGGSVANTENDIENVVNGVAGIYLSQIGVVFQITTIVVRTAEPDPYTTNVSGDLLEEFRIEWTTNQVGVDRDLAHLFSGRNLQGGTIGIAYTSSVCQNSLGYGLHQRDGLGFNGRVSVCAHEIGHNFSAPHCNGAPGGCNIMCAFLGGCSGIINSFANTSVNTITNYANIQGCLDDPTPPDAPVISGVVPAQVPALVPGPAEHFSLVGLKLDGVTDVIIDGISVGSLFPPGYTIISPTQIDVKLPLLDQLGFVDVTVQNVTGSDSTVFEVVPASPPSVQLGSGGDPETLLSILPLTLTTSGQPDNVMFLWASFTLLPTTIPGTLDLDIGNFFLDLYLAGFPIVESKGWSQLSFSGLSLPPSTTIYFQGFEYDPITGALPVESTNLQTGLWLF